MHVGILDGSGNAAAYTGVFWAITLLQEQPRVTGSR
jgi:hypothetical protein